MSPNHIWNVDESGLGDVPKPQKVIGVTGERSFQTVSGENLQQTLVTYISAGGVAISPMVIFKASRVKDEWREAAPLWILRTMLRIWLHICRPFL